MCGHAHSAGSGTSAADQSLSSNGNAKPNDARKRQNFTMKTHFCSTLMSTNF
jgi:hypothetical protein